MYIKQKRSGVKRTAAAVGISMFLGGLILLAQQWLNIGYQSFEQPITRTPAVLAETARSRPEPKHQPNPEPSLQQQLQAAIDEFVENHDGLYGIYVYHLGSESLAQSRSDKAMVGASLYKLFVAVESLKMVEQGSLTLDSLVDSERKLNLAQCLDIMITISDNPCGVALQRITGAANLRLEQLAQQGYKNTDLRGVYPTTSAADVGRFYQNLLSGDYLELSHRQLLLSHLANQKVDNKLPLGLPEGVNISHKTGDLNRYSHDGGIVEADNGKYIIVVMSQPGPKSSANRFENIGELSAEVYEIINDWRVQP